MTDPIELVCRACTRTISLDGPIPEALATAEGFGWKPDGGRVICPKCSGNRPSRRYSVAEMREAADFAIREGHAVAGDVLDFVAHEGGPSLGRIVA